MFCTPPPPKQRVNAAFENWFPGCVQVKRLPQSAVWRNTFIKRPPKGSDTLHYTTAAAEQNKTMEKVKTVFKWMLQQPVLTVWSGGMHRWFSLNTNDRQRCILLLRNTALPIWPSIHSMQNPKTAKYADYFFPFSYWSPHTSASRCLLSRQQLFFAMFVHNCIFMHTIGRSGPYTSSLFCACVYMCSDWQHALNSVSLSLCTTKESSAFVFKSSERQALRSRPSEDNLQWAGANLLSAYSEERGWRKKKKPSPMPLQGWKKNSFIYWLITTLFRNYTGKTFTQSYVPLLRRIVFLINYPLITDRLIRDKYQRRPIPLGHVQYAPRAAIFVDLFGSKLASPASAASARVSRLCKITRQQGKKKRKTELRVFSCHRERRRAEFKDPTFEASTHLNWNSSGLQWNPLTKKTLLIFFFFFWDVFLGLQQKIWFGL